MGQLKLIHSLANMLGIFTYHKYLKLIPFKKIFAWSTVICVCTGLTQVVLVTRFLFFFQFFSFKKTLKFQKNYSKNYNRANIALGIPDKFFSIGDSLIIQTFAEINTIPLLVLACRLCPKNIEGTMYALLMSTLNFGSMLSYQFGGLLMHLLGITENNFERLWVLIVLANCLMLVPMPFLYFVDFDIKEEFFDVKEVF